MNNKFKQVLINIYYAVSANLITLIISIGLNLIVPKLLGVEEYSYWQLYVFYTSYVGFFHFGLIDGIYLKIGGKDYDDLNYRKIGTQFWYLLIFETFCVLLFLLLIFLVSGYNSDFKTIFIYLAVAIVGIITILKSFALYIFQATNRIKNYAQISKNDRYIYIILVFFYFLSGGKDYKILVVFDIFSKFVILMVGLFQMKKIIFIKFIKFSRIFPEIIINIKIGSNIMFSNIASMLIVGSVRSLVEKKWSLTVFGKLSFTLSVANMFLIFINSVGVVMYPILRKAEQYNLKKIYLILRGLFVPFTFSLLLFYIPIRELLMVWLPNYNESLILMGYLFPMIVYEGRTNLLINTYLKTLRKEKLILKTNLIALMVTLVLAVFSIFILESLIASVITILIGLMTRCILGEKYLSMTLNVPLLKENIIESILTLIFVFSSVLRTPIVSFLIYFVAFCTYMIINIKSIRKSFNKSKKYILYKE